MVLKVAPHKIESALSISRAKASDSMSNRFSILPSFLYKSISPNFAEYKVKGYLEELIILVPILS